MRLHARSSPDPQARTANGQLGRVVRHAGRLHYVRLLNDQVVYCYADELEASPEVTAAYVAARMAGTKGSGSA